MFNIIDGELLVACHEYVQDIVMFHDSTFESAHQAEIYTLWRVLQPGRMWLFKALQQYLHGDSLATSSQSTGCECSDKGD